MPGLIRGVARTAVIAGTATAVSNRVSRRQAGRWADQAQAEAYREEQAQPAYAPAPAPAPAPAAAAPPVDMDAKLAQLKELAGLKEAGVLSDFEFEEQKRRILGS
jgi:hypothetical protein